MEARFHKRPRKGASHQLAFLITCLPGLLTVLALPIEMERSHHLGLELQTEEVEFPAGLRVDLAAGAPGLDPCPSHEIVASLAPVPVLRAATAAEPSILTECPLIRLLARLKIGSYTGGDSDSLY